MDRQESYLYEPHLSPMSSYATDQVLPDSIADQKPSGDELLVQPSTGATMLGALGEWVAEAMYRVLLAMGEMFAPPVDPADPDAVYYHQPPL